MVVLKKVSDLDPVGTLASTDLIVINQLDGVSRKVNIAQIQGYGFVLTGMIGALNGVPSLVNGNIPDTQISNSIVRSPQLTSGLALKADQTALTNGLALKADQTALTNGLALKIDTTASVDKTSVQTISGVKTFSNGLLLGVPLPISQGGLGSTTVSTARANLGIFGSKYLSKTTNYTIADSESGSTIDVDSSAGSCTINLPPISNDTVNAVYIIRKIDSSVNTVTIHGNLDNDLINGSPTYVLSSRNQTVTLIAINAAGWIWLVQNNFAPNNTSNVDLSSAQSISGVKTFLNGINLSIPLPISQGGLGGNTVNNSRSNLGIFGSKYLSKTANYTILDTDSGSTIDVDSSASSITLSLPAAFAGNVVYVIRKTDASVNTVTIAANGTDLINGSATYVLTSQNQTITLLSRNTSFWIVQNNFAPNLIPSTNATQLQGKNISATAPLTGQTLVYNGTIYTPRVAGKILQVVSFQTITTVSNSTTTYVSTGVTATITPLFAASTILIMVAINGVYKTPPASSVIFRIMRGAVDISMQSSNVNYAGTTVVEAVSQVPINGSDSPASVSPQTYLVQFSCSNTSGVTTVQFGNSTSSIILMEVSA